MYSIVLMMAMSGSAAEAPTWGRHNCHGCTGASASYGCSGGASCHGGRGGFLGLRHREHGCHGGNSCSGGYGCTGAVMAAAPVAAYTGCTGCTGGHACHGGGHSCHGGGHSCHGGGGFLGLFHRHGGCHGGGHSCNGGYAAANCGCCGSAPMMAAPVAVPPPPVRMADPTKKEGKD
jgi:hypothetical protein